MTNRLFSRAAISCLNNALRLASAGDTIYKAGNTGLAVSLYVLAAEEITKAFHFRAAAEGMMSFDPKDLGKTWVIDSRHLTEHELKHLHFGVAAATPIWLGWLSSKSEEVRALAETWETDDPYPDAIPDSSRVKLEAIADSFPEQDPELEAIKDLTKRMESLKERGFYVDIAGDRLHTPSEVDDRDYRRLKGMFDSVLGHFADSIAGQVSSPAKRAYHLEVQRRLASKQTRPTG